MDDDADEAEIFGMALHAIDHKIKFSIQNNALDTLKMLHAPKKTPDIIFLDFYMPYLDGSEFLKLLRKIKGLETIPVVLYSGHSRSPFKDADAAFKNVQFMKKQHNLKDLTALLQQLLLPIPASR